jgi:hypothetical protein
MNGTTIATDNVVAVLLSDGWHQVVQGSFSVGALDFGARAEAGAAGFSFEEADHGSPYRPATLAGPLSSILLVRVVTPAREPSRSAARRSGQPHDDHRPDPLATGLARISQPGRYRALSTVAPESSSG